MGKNRGEQRSHQKQREMNLRMARRKKRTAARLSPLTRTKQRQSIGSILAKRMREAEENLLLSTGYKLKIVERGGTKLEDLLHRSDPCQLLLERMAKVGEGARRAEGRRGLERSEEERMRLDRKRNLVYQTYCITCKERDSARIREQNIHHHILNSKSEYNRLSIPRLSTRLGDKEYKKYEKGLEEEKEKEEIMEKESDR